MAVGSWMLCLRRLLRPSSLLRPGPAASSPAASTLDPAPVYLVRDDGGFGRSERLRKGGDGVMVNLPGERPI